MDIDHPTLGHARRIADELESRVDEINIVTFGITAPSLDGKREFVHKVNGSLRILRLINFIAIFCKILLDQRVRGTKPVVFLHMTDFIALPAAIICKIFRLKIFLWYAHKSPTRWIWHGRRLLNGVFTSTPGSVPKQLLPAECLGQSIDTKAFFFSKKSFKSNRMVHVGRLDPIKRIDLLLRAFITLRNKGCVDISLDLFGSTSDSSGPYRGFLQSIILENRLESHVRCLGALPHSQVASTLSNYDLFIHAYMGSLDKAILEATSMGIPVITTNEEYIKTFGKWSIALETKDDSELRFIVDEFDSLVKLSETALESELLRRAEIVAQHHGINAWSSKLVNSLFGPR